MAKPHPQRRWVACLADINAAAFWRHVDVAGHDECWKWTASCFGGTGYGSFQIGRRARGAHRVSWAIANGCWPETAEHICHHCDNPPCVNPRHLFAGSRRDNMQDMIAKGRDGGTAVANRAKTHCINGHELTEGNFYLRGRNGRQCKRCIKEKKILFRQRYLNGEALPPSWIKRWGVRACD